jgi:hypothetical protein
MWWIWLIASIQLAFLLGLFWGGRKRDHYDDTAC